MPGVRHSPSVTALGDKLYGLGGANPGGVNTLESYDPTTGVRLCPVMLCSCRAVLELISVAFVFGRHLGVAQLYAQSQSPCRCSPRQQAVRPGWPVLVSGKIAILFNRYSLDANQALM